MIQYEEHASVGNGNSLDSDPVSSPGDTSAIGLHVDPGHCDAAYARSLSTLIESEIIPRLMVAHAAVAPADAAAESATESRAVIGSHEIEAFAPLAMQLEVDALLLHVEVILVRGVAIDTVLVDLLAPTARLLGEFWEDERCDFVDVTIGLWRLQEVVHELSRRLPAKVRPGSGGRGARSTQLSCDRDSLSTTTIDDTFRRNGRRFQRSGTMENVDLLKRAEDGRLDIIGLTVTCDCHNAKRPSVTATLGNVSQSSQV